MASLWSREPRPRRDVAEPSATARSWRPRRAHGRGDARRGGRGARADTRRERRGDGVGAGRCRARRSRRPSPCSPVCHRREVRAPRGLGGSGARGLGGRRAVEAAAAREHPADAGPRGRDETTPRTARPRRKKNKNTAQVLDIHGRQKQQKRTATFFEFCRATSGVLLCTDVAARGLDIPEVNWIVQFDPPV